MNIFKNKYYKIFPLSIFITQCTNDTVTFKKKEQFNIFTTTIKVVDYNSDDYQYGELKEEDSILFHNDAKYQIKQKFDENNIIQGSLLDEDDSVCNSEYISNALKNYVYKTNIVKKKKRKRY